MPGRRNLQRELHQHDATAATRQRELYTSLARLTPDTALVGHLAIVQYFDRLGIRRLNGRQLSFRIVNAWRSKHACPILKGYCATSFRHSPITTEHALLAWLLARPFAAGLLFRVDMARAVTPPAQLPRVAQRTAA